MTGEFAIEEGGSTPRDIGSSPSVALAEFVADLKLAQVPEDVVAYARVLILDLLGAALAGVETVEAQTMLSAAKGFAPDAGPCSIWGTPHTTTAAAAALVNGVVAHAQELDDFGGADHSGAVVVPAVLAIAESEGIADGERVLEAVIAGYDIALRVLEGAGGYRAHNGLGWHSTGTCGSFGAAAAAARMLGLDAEKTAWALGIAGSFTGGVWAFLADGTMSKRYHTGRAAEIGLTAAYMARAGFTGPTRVLDAAYGGYLVTYCDDRAQPAAFTEGLGRAYRIMKSGIKPYAACRGLHAALDVVLRLKEEHGLSAEDIDHVDLRCSAANKLSIGDPDPRTRLAAQMSLPYGVAVALVTGRASLEEFEDRWVNDPAVRGLMGRVTMTVEPEQDEYSEPILEIVTTGGMRLEGHEPIGLGDPRNPLTSEQVAAKYRRLAARALPEQAVTTLEAAVFDLPAPDSLMRLLAALRLPG
ncbi:MAG: MmgE/PrpD family protein [Hyphomicrobiaceae bacterium]|nr:MmgE/PrpD family protein [Hyphomicrobiaceae bacterium]